MDEIKVFIRAMTVWNWLTLTAFCFACISVLNAIFSLRARYLDWQGQKSKVEFKKRLRELSIQIKLIEQYRKKTKLFLWKVLDDAFSIFAIFVVGIVVFGTGWMIRSFASPGDSSPNDGIANENGMVFLFFGLCLILCAAVFTVELSRFIKRVRNPRPLTRRIIKFLDSGRVKGLLNDERELVESILASEPFNSKDSWPPNYIQEFRASL